MHITVGEYLGHCINPHMTITRKDCYCTRFVSTTIHIYQILEGPFEKYMSQRALVDGFRMLITGACLWKITLFIFQMIASMYISTILFLFLIDVFLLRVLGLDFEGCAVLNHRPYYILGQRELIL